MTVIRKLIEGDEAALAAFLERRAATAMHIRSNLKREGFAWDGDGRRHQGLYYGAFDERGAVTGMIGYFWNGNVLMQPGPHLAGLLDALRAERREIRGVLGPAADMRAALSLLGLDSWPLQISKDEKVYMLDLADLVVPAPLAAGAVTVRPMAASDRALALQWRLEFNIEALGASDTPALRAEIADEIDAKIADGTLNVLEKDGAAVAMSGQDETLSDSVTVGPVWTPPAHRGNGHARAVVAGSLLRARGRGGVRSVLFTENPAAIKAYEAVGFRYVDDYGLTLLVKPFSLR